LIKKVGFLSLTVKVKGEKRQKNASECFLSFPIRSYLLHSVMRICMLGDLRENIVTR
jgi:hypothetical protein